MPDLPMVFEEIYQRLIFICGHPKTLDQVFSFDYVEASRKLKIALLGNKNTAVTNEYAKDILHLLNTAYSQKTKIFENITQIEKEEIVEDENIQSEAYDEEMGLYVEVPGHVYHYGFTPVTNDDRIKWYKNLTKELFTYHEIINKTVLNTQVKPIINKQQADAIYNFDVADEHCPDDIHVFAHDPINYQFLLRLLTDPSVTPADIEAFKITFGCLQKVAAYTLKKLIDEASFPYKFSQMEKLGCFYISGNDRMKAANFRSAASKYKPSHYLENKINEQIDKLKCLKATKAT